jgi:hypothetical protein
LQARKYTFWPGPATKDNSLQQQMEAPMTQHFAICTFRATGPIESLSELQAANIHNARTKPIPRGIADRPAPKHLMAAGT